MSRRARALAVLSAGFLLLVPASAAAQAAASLDAWLREAPPAARDSAAEILRVVEPARAASVPDEYFVRRLSEAFAKKVELGRAIAGLRSEMPALVAVAEAARRRGWPAEAALAAFLADAMGAVRNGLGADVVLAFVAGARAWDPLRAGAALGVHAGVAKALPPGDSPDAPSFSLLLAGSGLESSRFGSFVALAARARADGIGASTFYAVVARLLKSNASFAEIERAVREGIRR